MNSTKIFNADAAIRNAVLMIEDVLSEEDELGIIVETKYRNNFHIPAADAIVELC